MAVKPIDSRVFSPGFAYHDLNAAVSAGKSLLLSAIDTIAATPPVYAGPTVSVGAYQAMVNGDGSYRMNWGSTEDDKASIHLWFDTTSPIRGSAARVGITELELKLAGGAGVWLQGSATFDAETGFVDRHSLKSVDYIGAAGRFVNVAGSALTIDLDTLNVSGAVKTLTWVAKETAAADSGRYLRVSGNFNFKNGEVLSGKVTALDYGTISALNAEGDEAGFAADFVRSKLNLDARTVFNALATADDFSALNGLLYSGNLVGTAGDDYVEASAGKDGLTGLAGNDTLAGAGGDDKILGGDGNDSLQGGDGRDVLDGGAGADTLSGGVGQDVLIGGAGDDVLIGWTGKDVLTGGAGADIFKFYEFGADNADAIKDFKSGDDKLKFVTGVDAHGHTGAFTRLAGGVTAANLVVAPGATARDADDYLLVDTRTGKLYYDADGNGNAAAELVLIGIKALAASDILVDPENLFTIF